MVEQARNQGGNTRHNSAPRDRDDINPVDLQREQMRSKHLMNQSVDMSQIMHLQKQIANLSQTNEQKNISKALEPKHQLQLQNFGQNPGKNSKTIQNYSSKPNQLSNTQGLYSDNHNFFSSTMKHSQDFPSYHDAENHDKGRAAGYNYERDKLASAQTAYSSGTLPGEHREAGSRQAQQS